MIAASARPVYGITVFDEPVGKARPRARSAGGRTIVYTPTTTKDAEWRIQDTWRQTYPHFEVIDGPVALTVIAYLRLPASMPKKYRETALPTKKPDSPNLVALVADALEECAYVNDSMVVDLRCYKRYTTGAPRWEIRVEAL